jgi:hypothetical protein
MYRRWMLNEPHSQRNIPSLFPLKKEVSSPTYVRKARSLTGIEAVRGRYGVANVLVDPFRCGNGRVGFENDKGRFIVQFLLLYFNNDRLVEWLRLTGVSVITSV